MRFIQVIIILWVILLLLVGGSVVAGRIDPTTSELETLGLNTCNDRLCFLGIAPGITPIKSAVTILAQRGGIQLPNSLHMYFVGNERVKLGDSQSAIINLSIEDRYNKALPLKFGDVLSYLGAPCRIDFESFFDGHNLIILNYPYGDIAAASDPEFTLNVDLPIVNIYIFPPYASPDECERALPWLGFKSFSRYLNIWQKQLN